MKNMLKNVVAGICLVILLGIFVNKYQPSVMRLVQEANTQEMQVQESRRKTMLLKEEIEKQCEKINEEILDKNTISAGEYIGLKLIGF